MPKLAALKWVFAFCVVLLAVLSHDRGQAGWESPADRYLTAYQQYDSASCPFTSSKIRHFVYFARDRERIRNHALLEHPRLQGAQVMYSWAELEPARDQYDLGPIEEDLRFLESHGKKLFVQLQDTTFSDQYVAVPAYLLTAEFDGGAIQQRNDEGETEGWVAKRWNPEVRARFAKLLTAMGAQFDARVEGINLQESAIGVSTEYDTSFDDRLYAESLKANMRALKDAFPNSTTMQYANFMPGEWLPWDDKGFLRSLYQFGEEIGVGLGGPDLMIRRKAQLNHTIAMMHEHEYTAPLGIAIQDGNYIGYTGADGEISDSNRSNRKNLAPMLYEFARDFMKVDYMFWVDQKPYFEEDVLPCLPAVAPTQPAPSVTI
jgi:hypothetical protein